MLVLPNTTYSVLLALGLSALMIGTSVFILFYHDRKHSEIDQVVDFSFNRETLRSTLSYYRFMAISMLVFYVLFTITCLLLQADGYLVFADGKEAIRGGPIATSLFALDLVLRGALFDVMEHFEIHVTTLQMNRKSFWFVWHCFVFRMYFGLALLKILFSFAWIYGKITMARQAQPEGGG